MIPPKPERSPKPFVNYKRAFRIVMYAISLKRIPPKANSLADCCNAYGLLKPSEKGGKQRLRLAWVAVADRLWDMGVIPPETFQAKGTHGLRASIGKNRAPRMPRIPRPKTTLVVRPKVQMETFTPNGLSRAAARSRKATKAAPEVFAEWSARL